MKWVILGILGLLVVAIGAVVSLGLDIIISIGLTMIALAVTGGWITAVIDDYRYKKKENKDETY